MRFIFTNLILLDASMQSFQVGKQLKPIEMLVFNNYWLYITTLQNILLQGASYLSIGLTIKIC